MEPLQAAARFAALVWYTKNRVGPRPVVGEEARRFARENWKSFLPVANEGLGRLLLTVARLPETRRAGRPAGTTTARRAVERSQRLAAAV